MQHSTPNIINKDNKELYLFLLREIMLNALWKNNGDPNDIPIGIHLLRSKILAFERRYKHLYDNLVVLNQLFEQCQIALNQSVLDSDKAFDVAQLLYHIIHEPSHRKIDQFKKNLVTLNEAALEKKNYELFRRHEQTLKEVTKGFNSFKKNIIKKWGEKPEIFYVQDYLFSHHYGDDINNSKSFYIGEIVNGYHKIANYIDSILSNNYLFMRFFGSPENLAACVKPESYYLIAYGKNFSMVRYKQTETNALERIVLNDQISAITTGIMQAALDDKHFYMIFRNLQDILDFLNQKPKQNPCIDYGIKNSIEWDHILSLLAGKLLESPKFLMLLNNDIRTNEGNILKEIQKHFPYIKLEAAVRGKMTRYNSLMGLYSSSAKGTIPSLPKDVIRTITRHAEESIKDDHTKQHKKK